MCKWGYFTYDFVVSRITSYPHAFLVSTLLFEFQDKCITEKWFLPFYKRPGQKHNFTCCMKYTGQLLFIYFCEPRQCSGISSKIAFYLAFPYLISYKISNMYFPGMSVRMTHPSYPGKTRNTPSCTSTVCILNLRHSTKYILMQTLCLIF